MDIAPYSGHWPLAQGLVEMRPRLAPVPTSSPLRLASESTTDYNRRMDANWCADYADYVYHGIDFDDRLPWYTLQFVIVFDCTSRR